MPSLKPKSFDFSATITNPVFGGEGAAPHNMPFHATSTTSGPARPTSATISGRNARHKLASSQPQQTDAVRRPSSATTKRAVSRSGAAASGPAVLPAPATPSRRLLQTEAAALASKKDNLGFSERAANLQKTASSTMKWTVLLHRAAAESVAASRMENRATTPMVVRRYSKPKLETGAEKKEQHQSKQKRSQREKAKAKEVLKKMRPTSARSFVEPKEATASFFRQRHKATVDSPRDGRFVLATEHGTDGLKERSGCEDDDGGIYDDDDDDVSYSSEGEHDASAPFAPVCGSSAAISPRAYTPSKATEKIAVLNGKAVFSEKHEFGSVVPSIKIPNRPTSAKKSVGFASSTAQQYQYKTAPAIPPPPPSRGATPTAIASGMQLQQPAYGSNGGKNVATVITSGPLLRQGLVPERVAPPGGSVPSRFGSSVRTGSAGSPQYYEPIQQAASSSSGGGKYEHRHFHFVEKTVPIVAHERQFRFL